MALVQTELSADTVVEAMIDDGGFALEMWIALASGLNMGRLLDDAVDVLSEHSAHTELVAGNFENLVESIRS